MRRLRLAEHTAGAFDPLPRDTAGALHATGLVAVSGTRGRGRTVLRAGSTVGAVRAGSGDDTVEVHVRPKVGVPRLMWLLGHARDEAGWRDEPADLDTTDDIEVAAAVWFARRARRALAGGVHHDYVTVEETLSGLRGRLREADQLRRQHGIPLPLEVRYDDYVPDVAENQLVLAAVRLFSATAVPDATRRSLSATERALAGVSDLRRGSRLPATRRSKLTRRYEPALQLARLLLAGQGPDADGGTTSSHTFRFDMNRVFEDWLASATKSALGPYGGVLRRQEGLLLVRDMDTGRPTTVLPDLTWWSGDECLAVADVKYKRLRPDGPPVADVYQVLAYARTLGLRDAHLVYAAGGPRRTLQVPGSGARVHVHVANVTDDPERLLEHVRDLAERIARGAGR